MSKMLPVLDRSGRAQILALQRHVAGMLIVPEARLAARRRHCRHGGDRGLPSRSRIRLLRVCALESPPARDLLEGEEPASAQVLASAVLTDVAAGYRPCGHCMRERYKEWAKGGGLGTEEYPWLQAPKDKQATFLPSR